MKYMNELAMQQQMMKQQLNMQQQLMLRNIVDQARQSPWFILSDDMSKYQKIFDHFDMNKQGIILDT